MPAPTKTEFALATYNSIDDASEHFDVDELSHLSEDSQAALQELIDLPYGYSDEHTAKENAILGKIEINYEYYGTTDNYNDGSEYTYWIVKDKRDGKLWQTYSTHTSWVGQETYFDEFDEVEAYEHTETRYKVVK